MTQKDARMAEAYSAAMPNQFGNLHEQMKHLMVLANLSGNAIPRDVWTAIWNLQIEVSFTKPANPPFSRRTQRLGR